MIVLRREATLVTHEDFMDAILEVQATLLSLLYEFTCVTVVSKRVLDKNLFWFILSCLSSIFIKRKCHFYRPILVVSEILSQWEFLQYNSLIFLSLINLLISREI